MKTCLFFVSILMLFATVNANAQTTLFPSTQPMVKGGAFEIERIVTMWVHCGETTADGDKIYKGYTGEPNRYADSQPNRSIPAKENCHYFDFGSDYHHYDGGAMAYFEFDNDTRNEKGGFTVDNDNNVVVTFYDNSKKLLLITDQLMEGILVVREL